MVNVFGNTDFQKKEKKKEASQVFPRRFGLPASLFSIFHPCNEFPNVDDIADNHGSYRSRCQNNLPEKFERNSHTVPPIPYVFEVLACWDHTSLVRMDLFGSSILLFTCLPFLFYFNQIVYRFVFDKYGYNNSLKTVF